MAGVHWAGWALAVAGFLLAFAAAGRFVFRRTTLNPARQPAHLVVSGAHAWSRNPMYLALTIISVTGARPRRSLAVDLGRAALGLHELGRDPLRGSAPARNFCPRLRRLLSKGSALDLSLS